MSVGSTNIFAIQSQKSSITTCLWPEVSRTVYMGLEVYVYATCTHATKLYENSWKFVVNILVCAEFKVF